VRRNRGRRGFEVLERLRASAAVRLTSSTPTLPA
jgi:uncharacterized protein YacL